MQNMHKTTPLDDETGPDALWLTLGCAAHLPLRNNVAISPALVPVQRLLELLLQPFPILVFVDTDHLQSDSVRRPRGWLLRLEYASGVQGQWWITGDGSFCEIFGINWVYEGHQEIMCSKQKEPSPVIHHCPCACCTLSLGGRRRL